MPADMQFIAELPPGYDERTHMCLTDSNHVVVTHPDHPPLLLESSGRWLDLKSGLVHPAQSSSIS